MQNNKLSVSRNGNQSRPCATRLKPSRGRSALEGQRPVVATLGTGTEPTQRTRAGHVAATDRRVTFSARFNIYSQIGGFASRGTTQSAHAQIYKANKLKVHTRPVSDGCSTLGHLEVQGGEKQAKVAVEKVRKSTAIITNAPTEDVRPACGRTDDVLRLCHGIGYIEATAMLEP